VSIPKSIKSTGDRHYTYIAVNQQVKELLKSIFPGKEASIRIIDN